MIVSIAVLNEPATNTASKCIKQILTEIRRNRQNLNLSGRLQHTFVPTEQVNISTSQNK